MLKPLKIAKITPVGKLRTFDVEVADNHNFILSNNLLSHNSEDILGICEMPSPTSREITCMPLKRDRRMNDAQIRYLAVMPVHQICLVTRGKRAIILKRIQPPRCKYFKSEYGSFMSQWRKEVNKWTNTSHFVGVIAQEYQKREELLIAERVRIKQEEDGDDDDETIDMETPEELAESGDENLEDAGQSPQIPVHEQTNPQEVNANDRDTEEDFKARFGFD